MSNWITVFLILVLVLNEVCSAPPKRKNNDTNFYGVINELCVLHYYRIAITKIVPPRTYLYYHEALQFQQGRAHEEQIQDAEEDILKFRIVGGKRVSITEAPYTVMYGPYCGGTLIAPDWVLTSAHCKDNQNFIAMGSTYRSDMVQYPICAHFIHPLWFAEPKLHSHDYDYQLLLLQRPVPVTPYSRPIAIGVASDIEPGNVVAVTGWGHLQYKEKKMPDALHRVFLPIIPLEICRHLPIKQFNISTRMFCAGYLEGGMDSCQGDSGGPVVSNGKLVGTVSFGIGCAQPGKPGVYANIPKVRNWIRAVSALPL